MTDFNQKTHDTDVGSHGGQSRQMMEVFENQEFGSIRLLQEAGKTFFCASDVAKALGYVNPYAAVKRHCRGPLNSDFLSTTISLPRHWIRFVPVASWPLLPAAIQWIPRIRTRESIWRSGQNCWEPFDFLTTHSVPMPVRQMR